MKKRSIFPILVLLSQMVSLCKAQTTPPLTVLLNFQGQIKQITVSISQLKFVLNADGQLSDTFNRRISKALALDYYDRFDPVEKRGKLKSVNRVVIDYYDRFDNDTKRGKIKQIGAIKIDYYDQFDGKLKGKIKSVGDSQITYYDQFDGTEKEGKLKSIGNLLVEYYDRFDGPEKSGQIKSIQGNKNGRIQLRIDHHSVVPK